MLVLIKELIEWAEKNKCAVGAFNTFDLETTLGIVQGANNLGKPIIIQVSETTIDYAGLKSITSIVQTIAKNKAMEIPIALHLDHGKKFSSAVECIEAGFSSIMIDASDLPLEENIKITSQVTQYSHKHKVWAQGEIGRILKEAKEIEKLVLTPEEFLTDPKMAAAFVKKTKVDTLAVAIGNVHGIYKMKTKVPKLQLTRLQEIRRLVDVPLVLHGASGIPDTEIKKAISYGVRIINIDTEIRMAFREAIEKSLRADIYDPRKIMQPCIEAIARVVDSKVKIFSA
jgi:fructose-bisphosphate aldolase class II